ncbi:SIMPL domain-containing protein [Terriglobus saanensis]|uniref:DUF541 domain-containing protein n=1 Tax=Terriglobus saanensis (strain ATCC BAA-1853 / DSM 23119 / SP1PR4) TaxID=401053 RepID=E8V857_TERSS|nr:SIMPL domain-containing protein [Terriglobus saanensis]ADV84039.1 protein of unknown function DUF541 [Terriglobus saanensis SP1PR4]
MRILSTIALFAVTATLSAQAIQVNKDNRTIAITATDTAFAMADQAVVQIGYQDYGTDEQSAYAAGSQRSNAIIAALDKAHIPKDDVESEDQQLQPLSEYDIKNLKAEQKNYRFRITQSWSVKTSPEEAARILDLAVKAGANSSGSIGWQMKDTSQLEASAAEKAIAHAQRIAAQMAHGLNIHLGPLVYASNQIQEVVRTVPMMMSAMGRSMKVSEPLAIRSRKVSQSATVYAVFAIE